MLQTYEASLSGLIPTKCYFWNLVFMVFDMIANNSMIASKPFGVKYKKIRRKKNKMTVKFNAETLFLESKSVEETTTNCEKQKLVFV